MKNLVLALDTGGTNTDAVLFDKSTSRVVASAKAFTTHDDLAVGIVEALKSIAKSQYFIPGSILSVNLSTTLATNAIAEGQGHRVGLIMIGFDRNQAIVQTLLGMLPAVTPIFVAGGHDYYGRQEEPLDEAALLDFVHKAGGLVSAWAVSSFFSIKNPAHELRAAQLISSRYPQPITMGQSLSGELGAMRRAATAALNAGLVIIINRLLDAVAVGLKDLGLTAPIMVVKGDGGLVGEQWARQRPIETVVSGPAAGLVGGAVLAKGFLNKGQNNLWILDVGGTTADLAYLKDGRPKIDPNGAKVGQWHTMVEAVETRTKGLGGDSLVDTTLNGDLSIGPRRVLPLARLAMLYPEVADVIGRLDPAKKNDSGEGYLIFFIPNLPPGPHMGYDETEILKKLSHNKPLSLYEYQKHSLQQGRLFAGLKALSHPAILVSGFTPTDALNVLGLYSIGSSRVSENAAKCLASRLNLEVFDFCHLVLDRLGQELAKEILSMGLSMDEIPTETNDFDPNKILGRAISGPKGPAINFDFHINDPVILLGAPAAVLSPFVTKHARAYVLVPPSSQVASAVGAAASNVSLSRKVDISALPDFSGYRAFLPDRLLDDSKMEDLITLASEYMNDYMLSLVKLAGSDGYYQVNRTRVDRQARLGDGTRLVLGATLTFTAVNP